MTTPRAHARNGYYDCSSRTQTIELGAGTARMRGPGTVHTVSFPNLATKIFVCGVQIPSRQTT